MKRILCVALCVLALAGLTLAQTPAKGPQAGDAAPTFSVPLLNKTGKMNLKNLFNNTMPDSDKVVVLSFFASWCKPCKLELPHVQTVFEKYQDKGLVVLAVFSEKEADKVQWAKDWFKESNLTFGLVHDEFGIVKKRYEIGEYPTSYILNRQGIVVKKLMGYDEAIAQELDQLIDTLMLSGAATK
jgi:thiol-disulfide isomerase/thioredoxin